MNNRPVRRLHADLAELKRQYGHEHLADLRRRANEDDSRYYCVPRRQTRPASRALCQAWRHTLGLIVSVASAGVSLRLFCLVPFLAGWGAFFGGAGFLLALVVAVVAYVIAEVELTQ